MPAGRKSPTIMPRTQATGASRHANATEAVSHLAELTDRMHGLLTERADALMGYTENSHEEAELAALTDVIKAYECQLGRRAEFQAGRADPRAAPQSPMN